MSPMLHTVCSSDFVDARWIEILRNSVTQRMSNDWRNRAAPYFQLLSNLCTLANGTISDGLRRFFLQSFVASSVLSEGSFDVQINASLRQFFQSTFRSFDSLIDPVRLLVQVDQPQMGPSEDSTNVLASRLALAIIDNGGNNSQSVKVRIVFVKPGTRQTCAEGRQCELTLPRDIDRNE